MRGADLPLELGILIDTSNSERNGNFEEIVAAAKDFVNSAIRGPQNRVFFMTFASEAHATDWMIKEQLAGLTVNITLGGGTALYDSLAVACKQRMGPRDWSHPTRRILVVISDGEDNASRLTLTNSEAEGLAAGVVYSPWTRWFLETSVSAATGFSRPGLRLQVASSSPT